MIFNKVSNIENVECVLRRILNNVMIMHEDINVFKKRQKGR